MARKGVIILENSSIKAPSLIDDRCVVLGRYILENRSTVRACAKVFGISKSTVHKDVSQRLKSENPQLYKQVKEILQINKQERHIRGGKATKEKYEHKRENKDRN